MPDRTLLTMKLHIPQLRSDFVPRPHLVVRLHEAISKKLTILSTPSDNDHGRFIAYVMAALSALNTGFDEHIQADLPPRN